ncbi:hypothetical protein [Actinoallomurus iriomotensis]|uniref:Uncharacterized protein n=1 Tax=Actinoallomurus iriomotensis TaxID=478107 RepID=A0A9W6RVW7_9ACTN|nr:hypothetical protein [Actinoallomurus iriomotensis]GLY82786.1 hypothetical protein Airi02_007170 [Actinoallomurus iriomotensis]
MEFGPAERWGASSLIPDAMGGLDGNTAGRHRDFGRSGTSYASLVTGRDADGPTISSQFGWAWATPGRCGSAKAFAAGGFGAAAGPRTACSSDGRTGPEARATVRSAPDARRAGLVDLFLFAGAAAAGAVRMTSPMTAFSSPASSVRVAGAPRRSWRSPAAEAGRGRRPPVRWPAVPGPET